MKPFSRMFPVLLSALLLLLALVVAAGFRHGDGEAASGAAPAPAPAPAPQPAPAPAPTTADSGATSTASEPAGPPHCTTGDLAASLVPGEPGMGQRSATVVLTNTSGSACRTYGYPGLGLVAADGTTLKSDVVWGGPGDPGRSSVTLARDGTASARMTWSAMPGTGDATSGPCQPAAASLLVTPPDERQSLHVPFGQSVCEKGHIDVTALVAGSSGPA